MQKLKEHQTLVLVITNLAAILVFLFQDFYGFRTNNFEKMTEKFALKETVNLMCSSLDKRLERIEIKLDALASKK